MATLKIYHEFELDGEHLEGDRLTATSITVSNPVYCVTNATVTGSSGARTLWTTGDGGLTTFGSGVILTDQDLYVEFRTDNASPEFVLQVIKANRPSWFGAVAGGDTTESLDAATLVDGTDFDDIDRIEVQNENTADATVSLYLFN